ncbi:hypothetical protein CHS0354_008313, partial [Potamilus streckersoni]
MSIQNKRLFSDFFRSRNGKVGARVPLLACLPSARLGPPATANRTKIFLAVLEIHCQKLNPRDIPGRAFRACGKQACENQKMVSDRNRGVFCAFARKAGLACGEAVSGKPGGACGEASLRKSET